METCVGYVDKALHQMAFSLSDFFYYFLIAVVQGITEFLPVSSSGHLVLLPEFLGNADQGLSIDVAAHIGTLLAVIIYVRSEIFKIYLALRNLILGKLYSHSNTIVDRQSILIFNLIIIATIPVIIAGFFVSLYKIEFLRLVQTVAIANLIFALFLWHSDKNHQNKQDLGQMGWKEAFFIGLAQMLAIIPGTSRSGVTITMARYLGFGRIVAARFSLLLSIPVIIAAGFLQTLELLKSENVFLINTALIVIIASFSVALAVIHAMMSWLRKRDFSWFVYYRLALGFIILFVIY
tara:strand:- start:1159 stop:2037 length:879 start_codon:yes stop_codon:yes gene_type:complete